MDLTKKNKESESLETGLDYSLARRLPLSFAKRYNIVPLRISNGYVEVAAVRDLFYCRIIDDLRAFFRKEIKPRYINKEELMALIARVYYEERVAASGILDDMKKDEHGLDLEVEGVKDLLEASDEGPIIAFVNSTLAEALKKRASDIHFEPFEKDVRIRYRIDGVLYDSLRLPKSLHPKVSSRVKVMAGLNLAERRLPQDGRMRVKIGGKDIDIRASVLPTAFGERVVLRLLYREDVYLSLKELGFEKQDLEMVSRLIRKDHGLILTTGPTGSGKTTTLYTSLSRINSPDKNILTIEDPIEYQLKGIGQMQVNSKIGLTFANGLRHILRQDPDIIMIGEIRDRETAEIAIHASLTGHLVFSTLHTNDSAGAIARLIDMGIEPFLVSASLLALFAQRLVRTLCPYCKKPYQKTLDNVKDGFSSANSREVTIYRNKGCDRCFQTGYYGRAGIYELLVLTDPIRRLIVDKADTSTIRKEARRKGMMSTLRRSGWKKVFRGVTTEEEVMRVTQEE